MEQIKLWVNPNSAATPKGYINVKSVNEAIRKIEHYELINDMVDHPEKYGGQIAEDKKEILVIDMTYDSMEYKKDGGYYVKLLEYFEKREAPCPYPLYFRMSVEGYLNQCRSYIARNGWTELAEPLNYKVKHFSSRNDFKATGARGFKYIDDETGNVFIYDLMRREYILYV